MNVKEIKIGEGNYKLSGEERETVINYNETPGMAEILTYNKALIRRLDGYCEEGGDIELIRAESINGIQLREYRIPKKWIRIRKPKKRVYTEEQRKVMGERLQKARNTF